MHKLKVIISKLILRIARISPDWGNRVMDTIGYDNYVKVAHYQKEKL